MSLLSEFLRPGEIILVSCCNLGNFRSRYSLAVLTAEGIGWLDLDDVIDPSADIGMVGLVATEKRCFVAMQGKRPRIVTLSHDLTASAEFECPRALDLHSLAERDGVIYAAATGRNQILSIDCPGGLFSGEERVCFSGAAADRDLIHLNSVCVADDTLLFSMFGARRRGARHGALVDAATGATVCGPLLDPHSLTYLGGGALAFCESLTSSLCVLELGGGELRKVPLAGYTRGCCFTGRHFVVGSSRWRHKSRSMGSLRDGPAPDDPQGPSWQRSALYFLNRDFTVARRLDFTHLAPEIYDIVYLGDRFTAARVFEDAATRRLNAIYDEIHRASAPSSPYSRRRA